MSTRIKSNLRDVLAPKGFGVLSFFFGLAVGLVIAAYLAFYVTKTPVPFADKLDGYKKTPEVIKLSEEESNVVVKIAPSDMSIFIPEKNTERDESRTSFEPLEKIVENAKLDQPNLSSNEQNKSFFLQVGAFRKVKEADRMRAKLAFLGFEASIYKKNKKGNLFFRVRLGPYNSLEELNGTKKRLSENRIKSHAVLVNR